MRKIISILLALGLILGLSVMATPASANVSAATVIVTPPCAGSKAAYNITFTITASLTEGFNKITIKFPAGTVIPTPVPDVAIDIIDIVGSHNVFGSEVTVSGTTVTIVVPDDIAVGPISVIFNNWLGPTPPAWAIVNPPEGTYNVYVNTDRAPDATPVKSADYNISPAISEYDFSFDFSPTYPGLAAGFVPPFKACGQNDTGADFDTVYNATINGWLNQFDLTLATAGLPGCAVPCDNVTVTVALVTAPAGATVTLQIGSTWYTLDLDPLTAPLSVGTIGVVTLTTALSQVWASLIHVNLVGDYKICLYADCPTVPPCSEGTSGTIADECMEFHAYQWKDATSIDLYRKWNLISLPLVPFNTNIDTILAALPAAVRAEIISIWNFDQCTDKWSVKGQTNSFQLLTKMEDGKSYWIRAFYDLTHPAGAYLGTLWIWGTAAPMPPDAPSAYAVCKGWDMVGFRSMASMLDSAYLWNFTGLYGTIYGWDATTQSWVSGFPGSVNMMPGDGYWIPFSVDGTIYP